MIDMDCEYEHAQTHLLGEIPHVRVVADAITVRQVTKIGFFPVLEQRKEDESTPYNSLPAR
jgi:hypothetical protein